MQNRIKYIIFDFDDTLCMTQKYGFELENYVAEIMGHKRMTMAQHISNWGKPLPEVANIRFPGINVDEFMSKISKEMKTFTLEGKFDVIDEQTLNILSKLSKKYTLGIVTSRTNGESQHLRYSKYPLSKYISKNLFFYRERTKYTKPDPRVFNKFLNKYKISPRECIYVGDSPTDAIAAKLAGMYFICTLQSGIKKKSDFIKGSVDGFVKNLSFLEKTISRLSSMKKEDKEINYDKKAEIIIKVHKQMISVPHDYFYKRLPEVKKLIDSLVYKK